jgi:hypothetical protein
MDQMGTGTPAHLWSEEPKGLPMTWLERVS